MRLARAAVAAAVLAVPLLTVPAVAEDPVDKVCAKLYLPYLCYPGPPPWRSTPTSDCVEQIPGLCVADPAKGVCRQVAVPPCD